MIVLLRLERGSYILERNSGRDFYVSKCKNKIQHRIDNDSFALNTFAFLNGAEAKRFVVTFVFLISIFSTFIFIKISILNYPLKKGNTPAKTKHFKRIV